MVKSYNSSPSWIKEKNNGPSLETINRILNYSKSIEVLTTKKKAILHLN